MHPTTLVRRIVPWLIVPLTALAATGGASCSAQPKGALMLAISTDMQTPKDMSVVSIFVATNGVAKFDYLGRVLPDGSVALPATLALIQPDDPQAQVHIRVVGFQEQKARVLRDVLTTVPEQTTALLRLPLDFIDDGSAIGTLPAADVPLGIQSTTQSVSIPTMVVPLAAGSAADAAPEGATSFDPLSIMSKCPTGLTSINGTCQSETVDSSTLPAFVPSAVFGDAGVMSNGAPASCFDTTRCFADAAPVTNVDLAACTFPVGAAGVTNLALVTPSTGVCLQAGQCFVPLQNDATEGWVAAAGQVTMIAGVCAQLTAGTQLYASTASCPAEVTSLPVCEPTTVAEVEEAGLPESDGAAPDAAASGRDASSPVDATLAEASVPDAQSAPPEDAEAEDDGSPGSDATFAADAPASEAGQSACVPATCSSLGYECGPAADGCGGVLSCGLCSGLQICGGGGSPFVCGGCTAGLCAQVATCGGSTTTTITGKVYSPSGSDPVPDATVYIPSGTVSAFADGPVCDSCGGTPTSAALVSTLTAADGSFVLGNVPSGNNIPLVVQVGRWRRQFTENITSCVANAVANLLMPANQAEGDIPLTAISTGAGDTTECILYKMGIDASEFTGSNGTGRIRLYSLSTDTGAGAVAQAAADVGESTLMTTDYANFDQILFPCQGAANTKTPAELANFISFVNDGGKVLATHDSYVWMYQNGSMATAADWDVDVGTETTTTTVLGTLTTTNSTGQLLNSWLNDVGGESTAGDVSLIDVRHDVDSVSSPSVDLIDGTDPTTGTPQNLLFTFDTPIGSSPTCGRVAFADFHEDDTIDTGSSIVFPAECNSNPLSPQEKVFESMIWDLAGSTCVQYSPAPTCTPMSCAAQGIACGPAGDGCGNIISSCGTCTGGQTCGGGGFGQCG